MSNEAFLVIENLHANIDGTPILKGVNLTINAGEVHALMGRNGTGKSTLSHVLMGHPSYEITEGSITFKGQDICEMEAEERAQLGMFLAFQYPTAIPGVTVVNFLRAALKAIHGEDMPVREFRTKLFEEMDKLGIEKTFASRYVNDGFSGGEKKRLEILQLAMLQPGFCMLDETDSGLDIDALQVVAEGVNRYMAEDKAVFMVTHYQRLLNYIKPDFVHVMVDGVIAQSGGPELAEKLEAEGYDWIINETKAA